MAGVDLSMTGWVDWGGGFGSSFGVSFDAPAHRSLSLVCSDAVVTVLLAGPGRDRRRAPATGRVERIEAVAANAVRNMAGVDLAMSGWVDWGGGFGSSFGVSFDAPPNRAMGLVAADGVVTVPGWHSPGPIEPSELVVERRDGSVERIACAGAEAYTELVRQIFADVVAGVAQHPDPTAPVFGRDREPALAPMSSLQRLPVHVASAH